MSKVVKTGMHLLMTFLVLFRISLFPWKFHWHINLLPHSMLYNCSLSLAQTTYNIDIGRGLGEGLVWAARENGVVIHKIFCWTVWLKWSYVSWMHSFMFLRRLWLYKHLFVSCWPFVVLCRPLSGVWWTMHLACWLKVHVCPKSQLKIAITASICWL